MKKNELTIKIVNDEFGFTASVSGPEWLKNVAQPITQGETFSEVMRNAAEAILLIYLSDNPTKDKEQAAEKFMLRGGGNG